MSISAVSTDQVMAIANRSTGSGSLSDEVSIAVMKKALDMQKQQASSMIDSASQPPSDSGARVGKNVNITV